MTEQERQYADIMARVSVQDGRLAMDIRTSRSGWGDVHADMLLAGMDDERVIEWLYGQFDQVLAELRRLARRGQFCRANESEADNGA